MNNFDKLKVAADISSEDLHDNSGTVLRATISLPALSANYINRRPDYKISKLIDSVILDYQYSLLAEEYDLYYKNLFYPLMSEEERSILEDYLRCELFKVSFLFDAVNNKKSVSQGMRMLLTYNDNTLTQEILNHIISEFVYNNSYCKHKYGNAYFFKKLLIQTLLSNYVKEDGTVELHDYESKLSIADKLDLKVCKDIVEEIVVYKGDTVIDFCLGERTRIYTMKSKMERLTGCNWDIVNKVEGNTDCTLIKSN